MRERNSSIDAPRAAGFGLVLIGLMTLVLAGVGVAPAGAARLDPNHEVSSCHDRGRGSNHDENVATAAGCCASPTSTTTTTDVTTTTEAATTSTTAAETTTEVASSTTTVAPTSTTTAGATTTTTGESPTTVAATTTVAPGATTSSTADTPTVPANALGGETSSTSAVGATGATGQLAVGAITARGATLPFTGSPARGLAGVGFALVASGLGLIVRKRRLSA